jgi:probable addiction module antidote protein
MSDFISKNTASYQDNLIESLKDIEKAEAYLKVALEEYEEDKDPEVFLLALKNVAEAQGGISKLSIKTHLNRQNLYRALSSKGNPTLDTLDAILHGLGFRLSIEAINQA